MKEALDIKFDLQLAKYLGISRQSIGAARKREDVAGNTMNQLMIAV